MCISYGLNNWYQNQYYSWCHLIAFQDGDMLSEYRLLRKNISSKEASDYDY